MFLQVKRVRNIGHERTQERRQASSEIDRESGYDKRKQEKQKSKHPAMLHRELLIELSLYMHALNGNSDGRICDHLVQLFLEQATAELRAARQMTPMLIQDPSNRISARK